MTKWDRIIADVQNTDDTAGALAACAALDRAADRSRLPHLYSLLKGGSNFFVREAAAVPVARLDGLRALSHLLEAMRLGGKEGHDNDGMCSLISDVVSENPRAAAPILTEMIRGRSAQRRADAAWLMGFAADALGPELLLKALSDRSPRVRWSAAGSLSSFQARPAVLDGLIRALADTDERVRVSAASALGYYGDRKGVPALRQALRDPAERVRDFARYALNQLEGSGARRSKNKSAR